MINPNWKKQQEMMAKLGPFIATIIPAAPPTKQVVVKQVKPKEKVEEKPKKQEPEKPTVKDFYDVKIVSYPATSKIRIIKEFRAIVGLGLKEAKDQVEKVPFIAFKRLKKEEADELVTKFQGYGAKMELI